MFKFLFSFTLFCTFTTTTKSQVNIYFDFDKSNLNASEIIKLDAILFNKDSITNITAHTDTTGSILYNKALAKRRLTSVLQYLQRTQRFDVAATIIGETDDITPKDFNRRVTITLFTKPTESIITKTEESDKNVKQRFSFNKIYFHPSTPIFKPEAKEILLELLETVKKLKGEKLELRGHVNHPSWYGPMTEVNNQLSYNRAKAVFEYLKSNSIDVSNITIRGMSNTEMVYPEPKNMAEMEMNMRVEVVVLN